MEIALLPLMPGPLEGVPEGLWANNPFGIEDAVGFLGLIETFSISLLVVTALAPFASLLLRFHRV